MFEAAAVSNPNHLGVKVQAAADLRELGRLDEAEVLLREVLNREDTNFDALVGLGHVLRRRGERTSSLAAFEAAALVDPKHAGVIREVVNGLRDLGRLEEAAARLEQLLANNSKNVAALVGLGSIRLEQFRLDEAERLFRTAAAVAQEVPTLPLFLDWATWRAAVPITLRHSSISRQRARPIQIISALRSRLRLS